MFSDIIEKNNEAKSFLVDSNKTLDNGEMYIEDGNNNKVTDEILESIEAVEKLIIEEDNKTEEPQQEENIILDDSNKEDSKLLEDEYYELDGF